MAKASFSFEALHVLIISFRARTDIVPNERKRESWFSGVVLSPIYHSLEGYDRNDGSFSLCFTSSTLWKRSVSKASHCLQPIPSKRAMCSRSKFMLMLSRQGRKAPLLNSVCVRGPRDLLSINHQPRWVDNDDVMCLRGGTFSIVPSST